MSFEEKELIQKTLRGEQNAFDVLVEQNKIRVYRHCFKIVHDEQIAEDLTQETFLHAFAHLDTFRMESKLSTWLWRISHNLCLNYLKKQAKTPFEFHEDFFIPKEQDKGLDAEQMELIEEAMQKLPAKQRIVFEMYDLQRVPQKKIAEELGVALGTVRSRLFYARRKMRVLLENLKS